MLKYKIVLTDESKRLLKNNSAIASNWINGLRSKKYGQIQGAMANNLAPNSTCCLGIAEIYCNNKTIDNFWEYSNEKYEHSPCSTPDDLPYSNIVELDGQVLEDLRSILYTKNQETVGIFGCHYCPVHWNDILNMSFNDIADLIENGEFYFKTKETI